MIEIDGSFGEGGGQILRTLLTLSALTGTPFRLYNIRRNRPKPGLQRSHLSSVNAVSQISNAQVRGNYLNSTELEFIPHKIEDVNLQVDVGSAGSITLVLQSVLPLILNRRSSIHLKGGTDVPKSPTMDYFRYVFLGALRRVGIEGKTEIKKRGYYPKGGGEVHVSEFRGGREFSLLEMGEVTDAFVISHVTSLPLTIAEREANAAFQVLSSRFRVHKEAREDIGIGNGTSTLVFLEGGGIIGSDSLGALGKRAEDVGKEAANNVLRDFLTEAAVDSYLSDMLMVYSSIFGGEYKGARLTCHARTNAEIIRKFGLEVEIAGNSPFFFSIKEPLVS
ncbi:RNA 3'-terminal phosphate cyclase [Sulfuracidifex metallicus]|uniref:RNA 3'-terminal phosphate cyclase n=1 Tax=Sulfuracidifex metallicus TaxID=47303 RepID=UPI0022747F45|nr:RNA 3'-terminal phosphate cyclase [Sulfuracidifex metallicus]MCY0850803.1 RNA 3'-terminal phosphate cyclase [Sulfuracidifex metallicus]